MSAVARASDALPAHKFTRANDSKALAALLRDFFATGFEPAPIRLAEGRGRAPRPSRFASRLDEAEKRPSAHFAMRNETFRIA